VLVALRSRLQMAQLGSTHPASGQKRHRFQNYEKEECKDQSKDALDCDNSVAVGHLKQWCNIHWSTLEPRLNESQLSARKLSSALTYSKCSVPENQLHMICLPRCMLL